MKKLFTSFVAAGTVASFAACHKKKADAKPADTKDTKTETKTETKTTTVKTGTVKQGTFKVGYVGSNAAYFKLLGETVKEYTQDITDKTDIGKEYFDLPSGLFLQSSAKYNAFSQSEGIKILRQRLKENMPFFSSVNGSNNEYGKYSTAKLNFNIDANNGTDFGSWRMMLYKKGASGSSLPTDGDFDGIFTDKVLTKIYEKLPQSNPTSLELFNAFKAAGVTLAYAKTNVGYGVSPLKVGSSVYLFSNKGKSLGSAYWWLPHQHMGDGNADGSKATVVIFGDNDEDGDHSSPNDGDLLNVKLGVNLVDSFGDAKKALSDKTILASKNLDALFIHVSDGTENSSDVYKTVVEKKEFKNTKLFFVGDKAKAQDGASSKVFAGGNVSTASFSEYAAAYVAGFQSAVGAIRYSSSEDVYEETNVVFLIGSDSESKSKKKAFAFRRGVEAAAAHSAYSKYLKVKFVSKTADSSKSSKKLYREISEWTAIDDSKTKLYEFSSSDTFSDADRRIVYIAGATVSDWTGSSNSGEDNKWKTDDKTGLIGALYNYKKVAGTTAEPNVTDSSLASKTFGASGVWVIVDKAIAENDTKESKDKAEKSNSFGGNSATNADDFERRQVKFMGFVGQKAHGTKYYVKFAIKGHFMGGANYMVGKHTVFGSPLETTKDFTMSGNAEYARKNPWAFQNTGKDTEGKNIDRYKKSLGYAWSMEVTEAELTKSSPWLK